MCLVSMRLFWRQVNKPLIASIFYVYIEVMLVLYLNKLTKCRGLA